MHERGRLRADALEELVERLIERLIEEGYLSLSQEPAGRPEQNRLSSGRGNTGKPVERSVKFEITDKGLDFLGYKSLKDLLGSLGRSSLGRHDTNYLSTGVEASQAKCAG